MTLQDWNFFYGKIEIFDFQQTPFKYVFSIAINVLLWDCMGKGACMKRMGAVRNCSTNTIMEKKRERGGRGLRIWNFQGYWRNSKWIFQRLIKKQCGIFWAWSRKNYVEFPGVLVLGLQISEGCNTIMWSF